MPSARVTLAIILLLVAVWGLAAGPIPRPAVQTTTTPSVVTERWGGHTTAEYAGNPQDVSLNGLHPGWAGDNSDELTIRSGGGFDAWALLYFDVSNLPPETVVRSAWLRLSLYSHVSPLDIWEPAHQILDPDGLGLWFESQATFNRRRPEIPWSNSGAGDLTTVIGPELDRFYLGNLAQWRRGWGEWDVTEAVRDWVADPATNQGLLLPHVEGGLYTIPSRENANADQRPYLEITYEGPNPDRPSQVTGVQARHRSGQTFITWNEIDSGNSEGRYRIYRHTALITASNLDAAAFLAEIPAGSGYYTHEVEGCSAGSNCSPIGQSRFIIEDDGAPLAEGVGLFVYTVHDQAPLDAYYAVTSVVEGNENRQDFGSNTAGPIAETEAMPRPVRVWTNDTNTGWVYTQFMDYHRWNPNVEGYAYNFYVGVPASYDPGGVPLSLLMNLHAYTGSYRLPWDSGSGGTDYGWPAIQIFPDDRTNTWWFGFGQNAGTDQPLYAAPIVDYTHQRLDAILNFVRSEFNVDENRMYLWGGSMGGSGTLNYGLRRGDVFAAIYAESAMTDFASAGDAGGTAWETGSITALWGPVEQDLPTNLGPSIWEWYDLQSWVQNNPDAELPFLADHHGRSDNTIDWETQGAPWYPALEAGRHGFVGVFDNAGHGWPGFVADSNVFTLTDFNFRRDESFPALSNASNSDDPAASTGCRNCRIEWSSSWNDFAGPPVDTADHYELVLRTVDGSNATIDITLQRLQSFVVTPGASYRWENRRISDDSLVASGEVSADAYGLITVPAFQVTAGGNRLVLEPVASGGPQTATSTPAATLTATPTPTSDSEAPTSTPTLTASPTSTVTRTSTPVALPTITPSPSPSPTQSPIPNPQSLIFQNGVSPDSSYAGTTDATITTWGGNSYANLGGSGYLQVGEVGDADQFRLLVRFELDDWLPAGVQIDEAWLELRAFDSGYDDGPHDVVAHHVLEEWVEGDGWDLWADGRDEGVTWSTARPGVNWATPGGDFDLAELDRTTVAANPDGWYRWDVTAAVRAWADGATSNDGLLLEPRDGPWLHHQFRSSEHSNPDRRPRLIINYNFAAGTATLTPTSTGSPTSTSTPTLSPQAPAHTATATPTATPLLWTPTRTSTVTSTATLSSPAPTGTPTATPAATSSPQTACSADVNVDGVVDSGDVQMVARWWHQSDFPSEIDVIHSGEVDVRDIMAVAAQWGRLCNATPPATPTATPTAIAFCPPYIDSPLYRPRQRQVTVGPDDDWIGAIDTAEPGTEMLLLDGEYFLNQYTVIVGDEVTIRSASGDRDAVLIRGMGYDVGSEGFMVFGENVTIADLSMTGMRNHAISIKGEQGAQAPHVYNVHLYDIGTQHIKGTPGGITDGVVACSSIGYTPGGVQGDYIDGVDIHAAIDWVIRDNVFYNIWGDGSGCEVDIDCGSYVSGPAVLMWNNARGTVVERNIFRDNFRNIAFGLGRGHEGGVIRNNFIYQSRSGDAGIELRDANNALVEHNTIILGGDYPGAIEAWNASGHLIRNNLITAPIWNRGNASFTAEGNITDATVGDLVAPGDPHLPADSRAIGAGVPSDLDHDIDGDPREGRWDVGADQFNQ